MTGDRLIVNADDFGMSRGITDAIVLAHRYGFLTSTSLMANMPAAEYAISRVATLPTPRRRRALEHLRRTADSPSARNADARRRKW